MKKLLILGICPFITACSTLSGSETVEISTVPSGALVTIDGVGECETPCSIRLDAQRQATIAKAGYLSRRVVLSPRTKDFTLDLELAAATDDVDAVQLDDL